MATRRRFDAQGATIDRDLETVLGRMGATSGRVETDITERDEAATVVFDRAGKRFTFRCAKCEHPIDNCRAARLTITRLWQALECVIFLAVKPKTCYTTGIGIAWPWRCLRHPTA